MVICKEKASTYSKAPVEVFKNESLYSGRETPNIRYANEGEGKSIQDRLKLIDQEVTTLNSRGGNIEEDINDLGLPLPAAKPLMNMKKGESGYKNYML